MSQINNITSYLIPSLIPFDMVLDIDFAILKCIQFFLPEKYHNMIDESFMKLYDHKYDDLLKGMLRDREFRNPVTVAMKPEYRPEYADELYNVMKNEDKLLSFTPNTLILNMIKASQEAHNDTMKFTISCEDEKELSYIISIFESHDIHGIRCVIKEKTADLKGIENIYVKQVKDLSFFKSVKGKNIMVPDYTFNLYNMNRDYYVLDPFDIKAYLPGNKFHLISLYNYYKYDESVG